jgi:hypothetical protein
MAQIRADQILHFPLRKLAPSAGEYISGDGADRCRLNSALFVPGSLGEKFLASLNKNASKKKCINEHLSARGLFPDAAK